MSEQPPPPPRGPHLHVQLDERTAEGHYCNLALLNHSDAEVVLDFAFYPPGTAAAKVRTRVIMAPRHAKRLLRALTENIAKYEARFGDIELGDEPAVH